MTELAKILAKYPDYEIKGMMYDDSNTSWGWLIFMSITTKNA